ncbi:MAG: hypothetical protein KGL39_06945 [Patescibacteria group bacterium]|nr:hypothetical protein [Patescibacteria group bacterium]
MNRPLPLGSLASWMQTGVIIVSISIGGFLSFASLKSDVQLLQHDVAEIKEAIKEGHTSTNKLEERLREVELAVARRP